MARKYTPWGYWQRFVYNCGAEIDVVVNTKDKNWRTDIFTKRGNRKTYAERGSTAEIKDGQVADLCHNNHCPFCK